MFDLGFNWRIERDSNPRGLLQPTGFRDQHIQPLWHLSTEWIHHPRSGSIYPRRWIHHPRRWIHLSTEVDPSSTKVDSSSTKVDPSSTKWGHFIPHFYILFFFVRNFCLAWFLPNLLGYSDNWQTFELWFCSLFLSQ